MGRLQSSETNGEPILSLCVTFCRLSEPEIIIVAVLLSSVANENIRRLNQCEF